MNKYEVIVGNVGSVHTGNNPVEANKVYGEYKLLSSRGYGRAGGECVTLLENDEIKYEYCPS